MVAENQRNVWIYVRDKIKDVILDNFLPGLTFCSKVTSLGNPTCQSFSEIAGQYKKLEYVMSSTEENPFRAMNQIYEILLTTNSKLLLHADLLNLLKRALDIWISRLYQCCGKNECTCFTGYLKLCIGSIRSYSEQELWSEISPGDELFRRAFGGLINRFNKILQETYLSIDYTILYAKDAHALQALLIELETEFCITYEQTAGLHINVGTKKLQSLQHVTNKINNHDISYFIENL